MENPTLYLTELGNFKDYQAKTRIVTPQGLAYSSGVLASDEAVVKTYSMLEEGTPNFPKDVVPEATRNLFRNHKINTGLGLGFAIASEGVLNVTMWGGDFPSLMSHNIFTFNEPEEMQSSVPFTGASPYCRWEGTLVGHESAAWGAYMASARTNEDKQLYLDNVFRGKIEDSPTYGGKKEVSLWDLDIPSRGRNALIGKGILSTGDLEGRTASDIFALKNVGWGTVERLTEQLRTRCGIGLSEEFP